MLAVPRPGVPSASGVLLSAQHLIVVSVMHRTSGHSPMGSHMRSMAAWLPPWPRNQSAKEMLSSFRTSAMPPSGSMSARTMGEVPSAIELRTCQHQF
jgi:hypothetical protein